VSAVEFEDDGAEHAVGVGALLPFRQHAVAIAVEIRNRRVRRWRCPASGRARAPHDRFDRQPRRLQILVSPMRRQRGTRRQHVVSAIARAVLLPARKLRSVVVGGIAIDRVNVIDAGLRGVLDDRALVPGRGNRPRCRSSSVRSTRNRCR
jgi:hypothetical protein